MHFEIDICHIIKPVHILCNVQLICYHWFQAQGSGVPPSTPQFLDVLTRISLSTYYNPNLPASLYQLITPKQTTGKLTFLDTAKMVPSDDATTVTGVSALTASTGLKTSSSRSGTFVKNPTVDTTIQGLLPSGVKITDLLGSDPVPLGDDKEPLYLSYHIRGGCFMSCWHQVHHAKTLSDGEKQRLSNLLVDQTAKLWAKFAAP